VPRAHSPIVIVTCLQTHELQIAVQHTAGPQIQTQSGGYTLNPPRDSHATQKETKV